MRSFVAVDLSKEVISAIEGFLVQVKPELRDARWVSPGNLHLTLRFLGETSEPVLQRLCASVDDVVRRYDPFWLRLEGIGFFPNAKRARVLWVGVHEPPQALMRLQEQIEAIAQAVGFGPEKRKFSPHLTLARFRERAPRAGPLVRLAERWEGRSFGRSRVEEVVVYQSILHPKGAEYRALQRLAFGRA